jgi:hypothetical protein
LAATKRPTSRSRIGSEGRALRSSLKGEARDGSGMKQMLHIFGFGATYETYLAGIARAGAQGFCRTRIDVL